MAAMIHRTSRRSAPRPFGILGVRRAERRNHVSQTNKNAPSFAHPAAIV